MFSMIASTAKHMKVANNVKSAHWSVPVSLGLSVAAVRASLLPRVWALLALGLVLDHLANLLTGLQRHAIATKWAAQLLANLPKALHEFADKAWVGPLGLLAPFLRLLDAETSTEMLLAVASILTTILIWGVFGSAICRVGLARMANVPIPGVRSALAYAFDKRRAVFGSMAAMLLLISLFSGFVCLLGLLSHIPAAGPFLAWLAVPVALIPAGIVVLAVMGLVLGWPLMVGAAMAEGEDMFDAVSRSQTYLFQSPVVYLLTFKVGVIIQALGYWLVRAMCWGLMAVLKAGFTLFGQLPNAAAPSPSLALPAPWTLPELVPDAYACWASVITHLAACWPIGFEFAFAGALYLALRLNVEGVAPTEIHWPGRPDGEFAGKL
jgi:hypothetical protein